MIREILTTLKAEKASYYRGRLLLEKEEELKSWIGEEQMIRMIEDDYAAYDYIIHLALGKEMQSAINLFSNIETAAREEFIRITNKF